MTGPEILSLVGSITVLVVLFEMLRRHRLREKYAVIWFVLAVGALVVAIFPDLLITVSSWLGLQVPSNLVFFAASLVLLGLSLQQSYELGRTEERVRTLAEEIALLRLRLDEFQGSGSARPPDDADRNSRGSSREEGAA